MDIVTKSKLSRRDFLKRLGVGTAAATATCLLGQGALPAIASEGASRETWGMLIDLTRCTGCDSCTAACKEWNKLPNPELVPTGLDGETYTFVEPMQAVTKSGEAVTRYVKRQCMHCLNAACVSACPAAAMYSSGEGPIIYRASRCLGCRYCEAACPFSMPRFNWDNGLAPKINKCWMCFDRLKMGRQPACVEGCPTGAVHFGYRATLVAEAHGRIASDPGIYVDHVYGESEVGGTSVLYLSDVPFEDLGFRGDLPTTAPPEETEKIMVKLPYVIGGMTAFMAGTALYTHRKSSTGDTNDFGGREE